MKSGTRRILSGVIAAALVATLSVPAMAAGTIKEQVNQDQQQTTAQPQRGSMDNFKPSSTYTGFQDVSASDWYDAAVKACYELDLMKGNSATTFAPKGNVTLAQAITMAARVHKIYHEGTGDFESAGASWYQAYVDYALEQGIIKSGDFADYDANATRSEMAYLFARALPDREYEPLNSITELPDVSAGTQYRTEIFKLYNAGIVTGSDQYGTYNAGSSITRAEAAAIINRVAVKSERKTFTPAPLPEYQTWNEGERHREPKVGDTVIKADGTKVVLKEGISGILGAGQGVDIYTGTVVNGITAKEGMLSWFDGRAFFKDSITGEMHTATQWNKMKGDLYPHGLQGKYNGEVHNTWFEYDSSDGLWYWIGPSVQ